jgi:hypothetical protein
MGERGLRKDVPGVQPGDRDRARGRRRGGQVADVPFAIEWFRYMGGWATKIGGTTIP